METGVVKQMIAHERPRNCSVSVCDSRLLFSDIFLVFQKKDASTVWRLVIFCSFYSDKHCAVSHCMRHKAGIFGTSLSSGNDSKKLYLSYI